MPKRPWYHNQALTEKVKNCVKRKYLGRRHRYYTDASYKAAMDAALIRAGLYFNTYEGTRTTEMTLVEPFDASA